jgi:hypothetical protein
MGFDLSWRVCKRHGVKVTDMSKRGISRTLRLVLAAPTHNLLESVDLALAKLLILQPVLVPVEMQITEHVQQQGSHRQRNYHCEYPKALLVRKCLYDSLPAPVVVILAHSRSEPRERGLTRAFVVANAALVLNRPWPLHRRFRSEIRAEPSTLAALHSAFR